MKPIPPGFCYAADNAVIPGRPWWRRARPRPRMRDPGAMAVPADPGFDRLSGAHAATVEDAERIDREYPLPHPGYRAGQVWLVPGGGRVTTVLEAIGRHPWGVVEARDGVSAAIGPLRLDACWLLFDPLMPHLAPWGPKE